MIRFLIVFCICFFAWSIYENARNPQRVSVLARFMGLIRRVLDWPVGKYRLHQFIPSLVAVIACIAHLFTFGLASNRAPLVSAELRTSAFEKHYGASLPELGIDYRATNVIRKNNVTRAVKYITGSLGSGSGPLTQKQLDKYSGLLQLPFPAVSQRLKDDTQWIEASRAVRNKAPNNIAEFLEALLSGRPDKIKSTRVDLLYSFRCDPLTGTCIVKLSTSIVRQHGLKLPQTSPHPVGLFWPHLDVRRRLGGSGNHISIRQPDGAAIGGLYYAKSRVSIPVFDVALDSSSSNTKFENTVAIRIDEAARFTDTKFSLRVDVPDYENEPVILRGCVEQLANNFESSRIAFPDFDNRSDAFCTIKPGTIPPVKVQRCLGDGPTAPELWKGTPSVTGTKYCAGNATSQRLRRIVPITRSLYPMDQIRFDASPDIFVFDRELDRQFLTLLDNATAGQPVVPLDFPDRLGMVRGIIFDYVTVLSITEKSPALARYLSHQKAQLGVVPTDRLRESSHDPEAIAMALARQPQLNDYYCGRHAVAHIIFEDLFAKLEILGLCVGDNVTGGECG